MKVELWLRSSGDDEALVKMKLQAQSSGDDGALVKGGTPVKVEHWSRSSGDDETLGEDGALVAKLR